MTQPPPSTDKLAIKLDRLMRRIHAELHPLAHAVDAENVGPFGGMVLFEIAETEPVAIHALTRKLGRDKAQMSRVVQALERKKLVMRSPDPNDQRVSRLTLTDLGQQQVGQFRTALSTAVAAVISPLSPDAQRQLDAHLDAIFAEDEAAAKP